MFARAALAAGSAEFAIRWDPAEGGPQTLEEIASALSLSPGKKSSFVVRYFSVAQPSDAPPDSLVIVRERTSGRAIESMYKLRGSSPFPSRGAEAGWQCPLETTSKQKREVDIGWTGRNSNRRNHSLSCVADGRVVDLLPPRFQPRPLDCTSSVTRIRAAGNLKVEHWSLPAGRIAFEVSRNGKDSAASVEAFAHQVVRPLMNRGVKPQTESKTALGSSC